MTTSDLLSFLRSHRLAVQASVSPSGAPQAAVVGFAVSDDFEFIFDTLEATRKIANLRSNTKVSLVVGGLVPGDERTAQIDGVADEPKAAELDRLLEIYFARFPDGRERRKGPGLTHVRVRSKWIRYSDYNKKPSEIVEFWPAALDRK